MNRHIHLDPLGGIAGDMFLGACIHLGAPLEAIADALRPLPVHPPYHMVAQPATRHGIDAVDFKVIIESPQHHHHDHDHHGHHSHEHHHTGYRDVLGMVDAMDAAPRARERARRIVHRLAQAEAAAHQVDINDVHFHEVGAVDSIVDMLGSAVAMELLGIESASCSPLPIGKGFVRCAHGVLPLPAPATAAILQDLPWFNVDREGETVTPTGAALVAALATEFGEEPKMRDASVGYGAGDRDDPDVPNVLRVVLGNR